MSDIKIKLGKFNLLPNDESGNEGVPLFSGTVELGTEEKDVSGAMPILALRNAILFPGALLPINIGRKKSMELVRKIDENKGNFVATLQRNIDVEDPDTSDLYEIGTLARVIKVLEMPDGSTSAILQGRARMRIGAQVTKEPYIIAEANSIPDIPVSEKEEEKFKALVSSLKDMAIKVIGASGNVSPEAAFAVRNIESNAFLINFIASNTEIKAESKQEILNTDSIYKRGITLLKYLSQEVQFQELKNDIQTKVKKGIDQQQREYLLQQQIRTLQEELGDNPIEQQLNDFRQKAKSKKWPEAVEKTFNKELEKLQRMNPNAGDYSMQVNYVETILDLPWNLYSKDNFDIKKAERKLNNDHYGLDKVKQRILEHLAVLKLKKDLKSPILCLYGPPGVGKTSLGKSIAEALGRKYVRVSLGGLHDEAEIRGHRRTYIGAMPGRIIQNVKKAGTSNPVFILDEIDKISNDFHGDPASALLEVLDPEQNATFHDNFLDIDYDLSKILFIATANNINTIAAPLLDRMELIDVSGYIVEEKVEIATRHLLPRQKENHGLSKNEFSISKKNLIYIIDNYTRESGVRQLDKALANICRKIALIKAKDETIKTNLTQSDIHEYLGVETYIHDIWQDDMIPGVVTGLAWTAVGGEILFIETNISKGKGKLTLTGNLGDVMKESAVLALSFVRSNAALWDIKETNFDEIDVHIHVPEGAIPKDGPSAGITMLTSIVSALTNRKVKKRIAMTGEITLRGKVLPVGGIKEKILAAKRAGITNIILSDANKKDIAEINEEYLNGLTFHHVKNMSEVIDLALEK